jgi:tRNA(adenine34) deaminase
MFDLESTENPHVYFMQQALRQAEAAMEQDEVPVGAVIHQQGKLIAAAHNLNLTLKDATAHAEMLAITQAAEAIGDWRLERCTLVVTLEPCIMCAGAILLSRIPTVVFGAADPKGGAVGSMFNLLDESRLNHRCHVVRNVLAEPCSELLTRFFKKQRALGKK